MFCPYCDKWIGEFDNFAFHDCPNEPPTDWPRVIRWTAAIIVIVFLLIR